jgi:type III pantothenate kinase
LPRLNIAVDIGNSRVKIGYFDGDRLVADTAHAHADFPQAVLDSSVWKTYSGQSKYFGVVSVGNASMLNACDILLQQQPHLQMVKIDRNTPLPIGNRYATPQTLGMDRICAAVGAFSKIGTGPLLVVNAGTAITYDYVDGHNDYLGGGISPGLRTRFRALHDYTAALPLVEAEGQLTLIGDTTETSIRSGVVNGVVAEIEGIVARYQLLAGTELKVILMGGDAEFLGNRLKNVTFVVANLLLHGINALIRHHA